VILGSAPSEDSDLGRAWAGVSSIRGMPVRRQLLWAAAVLAALVLVGCGSGGEAPVDSGGATSAEYVKAVEELLAPAGALAAVASDRLSGREARSADAAALVSGAQTELRQLAALRLTDSVLDAQRTRIVREFRPVLRSMRLVARHVAQNDSAGLMTSASELFTAIRELPSATSA